MLSSGGMQDQRSRPLLCFQMSASQRFQLLHSATSAAGRSAQDSMKMVLCNTWTSTPVASIYSKRKSTLPSSRDACWSANLRPTCCWRLSSSSSENAGKRKPRTLPSMTQNCWRTPASSRVSSGTGRYCCSDLSMKSQVRKHSTTWASASMTKFFFALSMFTSDSNSMA